MKTWTNFISMNNDTIEINLFTEDRSTWTDIIIFINNSSCNIGYFYYFRFFSRIYGNYIVYRIWLDFNFISTIIIPSFNCQNGFYCYVLSITTTIIMSCHCYCILNGIVKYNIKIGIINYI